MKQKEVFKKIGGIIQELSEQYEYLETIGEELNELELELFLANAHFLADHIEVLCKLNLHSQAEKRQAKRKAKPEKIEKFEKPEKIESKEPAPEPKSFEPVVQQMKSGSSRSFEKTSKEPVKPVKPVELEMANTEKILDEPIPEIDITPDRAADTYSFVVDEPETIRHELVLDEAMMGDDDDEKPEPELHF